MLHLDAALSIIEKLKSSKVMVVGDVMLDRFVYGDVARISPEAPIPVLRSHNEKLMPGGAGNVVANLAGLECQAHLIAVVGDDDAANMLEQGLQADTDSKINCHFVTDQSRPTSLKTRYLAGHQQLLRVDNETTKDITADIEQDILRKVKQTVQGQGIKTIILSDYGKGMLTNNLVRELIEFANQNAMIVLVDPKGTDYSKYRGATVVTPNKKELSEATLAMAVETDQDIHAATTALLAQSGIKSVVATRSADGMSICQSHDADDGEMTHLPTIAREVFDVSGAGDTVIATIAACLATGAPLVMAAAIANAAGGLVVEKVGTAAIRVSELRGFLLEDGHQLFDTGRAPKDIDMMSEDNAQNDIYTRPAMLGAAPILNWQDAADQVERWKARGLKVGFTNGAFDILHQGHVTYLAKSRALCDRLVLGLNCDASIKRYKSEERPINSEQARANVLSCLQSIDMVVIFGNDLAEEDTPLMLTQALRPDMITKGADYTIDQVVGADFVQSYGGTVELIDLEEGFSTTNTIKKLSGKKISSAA
jgi:D-beta-D-heptose 7-phosphate kinase/D-beta-D-heptose 1-phosphate adenosyltransferase